MANIFDVWGIETWSDVLAAAPPELRPWLMPCEWSRDRLWELDLPERTLPLIDLAWLLDLPWWRGDDGRPFSIRPSDENVGNHAQRVADADLAWSIHVTERHGRWVVLDGVHRLAKAASLGHDQISVRVVTRADLAEITIV